MRRLLVVSIALLGLSVGVPAQQRTGSIPTGGTPLISAADASKPVPRLPDGRVDLTGPWVGGGSNARYRTRRRIEAGRAAAAAVGEGAARFAEGAGRTVHDLPADERAAHEPVSVEVRDDLHFERADAHLRAARARRLGRAPGGLHGRPQASARCRSRRGGAIRSASSKATRW